MALLDEKNVDGVFDALLSVHTSLVGRKDVIGLFHGITTAAMKTTNPAEKLSALLAAISEDTSPAKSQLRLQL